MNEEAQCSQGEQKIGRQPERRDVESREVLMFVFKIDIRAGFFFASSDPLEEKKSVMQEKGGYSYKS